MSLPRIFIAIVLLLAATQISAATSSSDHKDETYTISTATSMVDVVTFYTTRAELDAVCGTSFPIEDFSGIADNMSTTCGSPVNSTNANCLPAGSLNAGFSILGDGNFNATGDVYLSGSGNLGLPNTAIGGNSAVEPTNITFDTPVNSVAFDLYSVLGTSDIQMDILDVSGGIIERDTFKQVTITGEFVGLTSATAIKGIRLKSQRSGKYEFISNLSFGTCTSLASNIPTMSQWAMFILGMILTSLALVYIRDQSLTTS